MMLYAAINVTSTVDGRRFKIAQKASAGGSASSSSTSLGAVSCAVAKKRLSRDLGMDIDRIELRFTGATAGCYVMLKSVVGGDRLQRVYAGHVFQDDDIINFVQCPEGSALSKPPSISVELYALPPPLPAVAPLPKPPVLPEAPKPTPAPAPPQETTRGGAPAALPVPKLTPSAGVLPPTSQDYHAAKRYFDAYVPDSHQRYWRPDAAEVADAWDSPKPREKTDRVGSYPGGDDDGGAAIVGVETVSMSPSPQTKPRPGMGGLNVAWAGGHPYAHSPQGASRSESVGSTQSTLHSTTVEKLKRQLEALLETTDRDERMWNEDLAIAAEEQEAAIRDYVATRRHEIEEEFGGLMPANQQAHPRSAERTSEEPDPRMQDALRYREIANERRLLSDAVDAYDLFRTRKKDALTEAAEDQQRKQKATTLLEECKRELQEALLAKGFTDAPFRPAPKTDILSLLLSPSTSTTTIALPAKETAQCLAELSHQKQMLVLQSYDLGVANRATEATVETTKYHRRALHNSLEEQKGNIRVVVRMRPKLPSDDDNNAAVDGQSANIYRGIRPEEGSVIADDVNHTVSATSPSAGVKTFEFFRVYGPPPAVGAPVDGGVASPQSKTSTHAAEGGRLLQRAIQRQQEQLFDEQLVPMMWSLFDGVNVSVMAYGQTGSGKTFTILGDTVGGSNVKGAGASREGLLPRALRLLVQEQKRQEEVQTTGKGPTEEVRRFYVTMTAVELYLDTPFDLFADAAASGPTGAAAQPRFQTSTAGVHSTMHHASALPTSKGKKLEFKQRASGGASVVDATEMMVPDAEQGIRWIQDALLRRTTHPTLMNVQSSRSHLIITLRCHWLTGKEEPASLTFVDLAGSERLSKSLSTGDRLKETQYINKSLAALGDVVSALTASTTSVAPPTTLRSTLTVTKKTTTTKTTTTTSSNPTVARSREFLKSLHTSEKQHDTGGAAAAPAHVPYRNSKLTALLQSSLGGNAKTLIVTCLCPHFPAQHNMHESISALHFASRARLVRNKPMRPPPAAVFSPVKNLRPEGPPTDPHHPRRL